MSQPLEFLARRAADDPSFLGYALQVYAASEELDDAGVARRLGCPVDLLARLRLCLRPRAEERWFWSDVEEIATAFHLDDATIAEVVRRADVVEALRQPVSRSQGTLMAARDRDVNREQPSGEDES